METSKVFFFPGCEVLISFDFRFLSLQKQSRDLGMVNE